MFLGPREDFESATISIIKRSYTLFQVVDLPPSPLVLRRSHTPDFVFPRISLNYLKIYILICTHTFIQKCVTLSSLCLSLSTNPEFSLSLSHPNTYQIVIVIHQICHKQGQLCLHMPSTDFAHAQLRVNMTQKYNL